MTLFDPIPLPKAAPAGGDTLCQCDRCGVPLRFRKRKGNADAQPIRVADRPEGLCATCALRVWFELDDRGAIVSEIVMRDLGGDPGKAFKLPHVQEQVKRMMEAGKSDARVEEIDFDKLVREWDLPIPRRPGGKRRA